MSTYEAARATALAAQEAIDTATKVMAESVRDALTLGFKAIFEKYPFITAVQWRQYTPYFNDGDPCVFSSQIDDLDVHTTEPDEYGWYEGEDSEESWFAKTSETTYVYDEPNSYGSGRPVPNPDYDPTYAAADKEISEFVASLRGDSKRSYRTTSTFDAALMQAFGDHVTVIIGRDGKLRVDECEHD